MLINTCLKQLNNNYQTFVINSYPIKYLFLTVYFFRTLCSNPLQYSDTCPLIIEGESFLKLVSLNHILSRIPHMIFHTDNIIHEISTVSLCRLHPMMSTTLASSSISSDFSYQGQNNVPNLYSRRSLALGGVVPLIPV